MGVGTKMKTPCLPQSFTLQGGKGAWSDGVCGAPGALAVPRRWSGAQPLGWVSSPGAQARGKASRCFISTGQSSALLPKAELLKGSKDSWLWQLWN